MSRFRIALINFNIKICKIYKENLVECTPLYLIDDALDIIFITASNNHLGDRFFLFWAY